MTSLFNGSTDQRFHGMMRMLQMSAGPTHSHDRVVHNRYYGQGCPLDAAKADSLENNSATIRQWSAGRFFGDGLSA